MPILLLVLLFSTPAFAFGLPCHLESPPTCPAPAILCGDVDLDGSLTVLDALLSAQHAVGLTQLHPVISAVADVYNPVVDLLLVHVDIMDSLWIAQAAVGSRAFYPGDCSYDKIYRP